MNGGDFLLPLCLIIMKRSTKNLNFYDASEIAEKKSDRLQATSMPLIYFTSQVIALRGLRPTLNREDNSPHSLVSSTSHEGSRQRVHTSAVLSTGDQDSVWSQDSQRTAIILLYHR